MKETIKIIRLESLPAFVLIAAAFAFVGCALQKNSAATRTASTPNSTANVARTPEAELSKIEPIERPFYEQPENVRPAREADLSKIVTRANFDRIEIGMSYREVVEIFGDEGMQTSTMRVNTAKRPFSNGLCRISAGILTSILKITRSSRKSRKKA